MLDLTHPVRLGILKERPFLTGALSCTYTSLVCNANLMMSFGGGVASLLQQVVGNNGTVSGFLVDPITHSLCVDRRAISNDDGAVKSGLDKLFRAYGLGDSEIAALPLSPHRAAEVLDEEFVGAVLSFQRTRVRDLASGDEEYVAFAEAGSRRLGAFAPGVLIAPYLYVDDGPDAELQLRTNRRLFEVARALEPDVAAYVAIHKALVDNADFRRSISDQLTETKPSLVLLWVTRLDEHRGLGSEFRATRDLMLRLARAGLRVVRLYGSFFTYTLCEPGLLGVAHGPGYGEERNEVPVGGGLPRPKFYMPVLHRRVDFQDALLYVTREVRTVEEYFERVCKCPQCRETLGSDLRNFELYGELRTTRKVAYDPVTKVGEEREIEYASPEALERATKHYMWCKFQEINLVRKLGRSEVQAMLRRDLNSLDGTILADKAQHLAIWAED